jgi:hypothetical protein
LQLLSSCGALQHPLDDKLNAFLARTSLLGAIDVLDDLTAQRNCQSVKRG